MRILSTGSYLPQKILNNKDLEGLVQTSDSWIQERTGISKRHIASDEEPCSELAYQAALKALEVAQMKGSELDMILVGTVTGDYPMPSTACILQKKLKNTKAFAFDLSAACSGFIYGLVIANQFLRSGYCRKVLLIGSEALHILTNYEDRRTCILFGDGAGAVLLEAGEENTAFPFTSHLHSDGSFHHLLSVPGGGSHLPFSQKVLDERKQYIQMEGQELFRHAVRFMVRGCKEVLAKSQCSMEEVDWLIPHQANRRILQAVIKHLSFSEEKVIINLQETGNTSSASIPLAFDEGIRKKKIQRGHRVLMTSFGAGLTSGACLFKY